MWWLVELPVLRWCGSLWDAYFPSEWKTRNNGAGMLFPAWPERREPMGRWGGRPSVTITLTKVYVRYFKMTVNQERKFKQLTYHDRQNIETMYSKGYTFKAMAEFIGCTPAAISYEFKRGLYYRRDSSTWKDIPAYSADIAQQYNYTAESHKGYACTCTPEIADCIRYAVSHHWSVRALCGDARFNGFDMPSHSTVYSWIRKGLIPGVTVEAISSRKTKYHHVKSEKRPALVPRIDDRPSEASDRSEIGHWEMDTVYSGSGSGSSCLLVLTERKTRFEIIRKLKNRKSGSVVRALVALIRSPLRSLFKTITCDNGAEFSDFSNLQRIAGIYYCHAYHSWERGSNENCNRLIRKIYPKGSSFRKVYSKDVLALQDFCNSYPRSIFGYESSEAVFFRELSAAGYDADRVIRLLRS